MLIYNHAAIEKRWQSEVGEYQLTMPEGEVFDSLKIRREMESLLPAFLDDYLFDYGSDGLTMGLMFAGYLVSGYVKNGEPFLCPLKELPLEDDYFFEALDGVYGFLSRTYRHFGEMFPVEAIGIRENQGHAAEEKNDESREGAGTRDSAETLNSAGKLDNAGTPDSAVTQGNADAGQDEWQNIRLRFSGEIAERYRKRRFRTVIASFMEFERAIRKQFRKCGFADRETCRVFLGMLSPFAPNLSAELSRFL